MADDSAVTQLDVSDPAPVLNGYPLLTATAAAATTAPGATAAAAPTAPPPRQPVPTTNQKPIRPNPPTPAAGPPPGQPRPTAGPTAPHPGRPVPPAAGPAAGARNAPPPEPPTPYSYNPDLLAEHALLGSLMYAPQAIVELDTFLGVRDFSTPTTRALYATLRGLHASGALFDVAALRTEGARLDAANENRLRLFTALRTTPSPFTDITVPNMPQVLNSLVQAAPPECLPFRGVYDPGAQLRMGRMVLEDSCRRQLQAIGVMLRRTEPLVTPAQQPSNRAERHTQNLTGHLDVVQTQLRSMTDRLVQATRRTGPNSPTVSGVHPGRRAEATAARAETRRWRLPAPIRALTEHRLRRAELHVIHLALNCGRMRTVPPEILNLRPDDFTDPRHANTWRTIQDLHRRHLPVNYVSVFHASRTHPAHQPGLSDRALLTLAAPPNIKPERVAHSLATVTTAALSRATHRTSRAITAITTGPAVTVQDALDHVTRDVTTLAARATTAGGLHRATTTHHTPTNRR